MVRDTLIIKVTEGLPLDWREHYRINPGDIIQGYTRYDFPKRVYFDSSLETGCYLKQGEYEIISNTLDNIKEIDWV